MAFRNIILPKDGHANPIENNSMNQIPKAGYFKSFEAGAGSKTMKMDERGMWMGSEDFETAPFSVDMNGNITIKATTTTADTAIRMYDSAGNLVIFMGFEDV